MPNFLVLPARDLLPQRLQMWSWAGRGTPPPFVPPFAAPPWVPVAVTVKRDGNESHHFKATLADPASGQVLAVYTHDGQGPQWFDRDVIYRLVQAQVYEYSEPWLGVMRWPTISDTANTFLFNLTEGSGDNQVATVPATVNLLAAVDSVRTVRQAVIVELMDDGQWRVAGYGDSQPESLTAMDLQVTTSGTLYAVGIDDYGVEFVPSLSVTAGQRVRPSRFAGWLYEITEPGVLPSTEPQWWPIEGANPSRALGTARAVARRYYRPLAHGPIRVEIP